MDEISSLFDTFNTLLMFLLGALCIGFTGMSVVGLFRLFTLVVRRLTAPSRSGHTPNARQSSTASSTAFSATSPGSLAAARRWQRHPNCAFKWAADAGWPRGTRHPGQSPLSFGGGRAYNGEDGPLGFTTRDARLVNTYLDAAVAAGIDAGGVTIEATDGSEWDWWHGASDWGCY
jgi:hypothetical protein